MKSHGSPKRLSSISFIQDLLRYFCGKQSWCQDANTMTNKNNIFQINVQHIKFYGAFARLYDTTNPSKPVTDFVKAWE